MGKLSFPISLLSGASAVTIAIADLATAGLPAGTILRDPTTGLIYGQSDGAGGYVPFGDNTESQGVATIVPRQVVNNSGSAANYVVCQPGEMLYGGFLITSGTALVTVRHGITASSDIIWSNAGGAPVGYNKLVVPQALTDGLFVTLSANGRVTFFVSEFESEQLSAGLPPETGPVTVPMSASGRFWLGRGLYRGFNLNAQTTAGTGIAVYDGWDNAGALVDVITASVVGPMAGAPLPQWPVRLKHGGFIELLGTGQQVAVNMGEAS